MYLFFSAIGGLWPIRAMSTELERSATAFLNVIKPNAAKCYGLTISKSSMAGSLLQ